MAKVSISLSQNKLDTFRRISASAVAVLARLAARNAVKGQLRDDGVRLSLVPPREINTKETAYLALHPELIDEARERAQRLGMYEKPKRRRRSVSGTESIRSGADLTHFFDARSGQFQRS